MRHKRLAAAETRADAKMQAAATCAKTVATARAVALERAAVAEQAVAAERAAAAERARELDVVPWLRQLGFRADEARRAAEHCDTIPNAPLEERVRVALSFLGRAGSRGVRRVGNNLGTAA